MIPWANSLPGASVHGILQIRILGLVAIPFSRGSSWPGIEPGSPTLLAGSLSSEPKGSLWLIQCDLMKIMQCAINTDTPIISVCSVTQSCPMLCDPRGCSLPGSFVHGIFQARTLGWLAISSSRGSSWPNYWTCVSCVSCIGRQILYCLSYLGATNTIIPLDNNKSHFPLCDGLYTMT